MITKDTLAPFLLAFCFALICAAPASAEEIPWEDAEPAYSTPAPDYITREDVAAMIAAAQPEATEEPDPTPEPTEYPGITEEQLQAALDSVLANGVQVHLSDDQLSRLISTPETASEEKTPTIWNKNFNDYTPQEGFALLTFVVVLTACVLVIFRRF